MLIWHRSYAKTAAAHHRTPLCRIEGWKFPAKRHINSILNAPVSLPNKRLLPRSPGGRMATQTTFRSSHNTGRFKPGDPRAGRKKGVPNKATRDVKAAAQEHGTKALDKLVALLDSENDETALKAARELLDRAYGKPAQMLQGDAEKPIEHNVHVLDQFTRRIAAMAERANNSS
jgi:hypothetical protein